MGEIRETARGGTNNIYLIFFNIIKHFPDDFYHFLVFCTPFLAKKHAKSRQKPSQSKALTP